MTPEQLKAKEEECQCAMCSAISKVNANPNRA